MPELGTTIKRMVNLLLSPLVKINNLNSVYVIERDPPLRKIYIKFILSEDLSFNQHIITILSKASSVISLITRNLRTAPRILKEAAYRVLVRPSYLSRILDR